MDIESRLRTLESRYRHALIASVAAKAHYLALLDETGSTPASIKRARQQWATLDARKCGIAARVGDIEDLEQHLSV
jgi:hypothetical protein